MILSFPRHFRLQMSKKYSKKFCVLWLQVILKFKVNFILKLGPSKIIHRDNIPANSRYLIQRLSTKITFKKGFRTLNSNIIQGDNIQQRNYLSKISNSN